MDIVEISSSEDRYLIRKYVGTWRRKGQTIESDHNSKDIEEESNDELSETGIRELDDPSHPLLLLCQQSDVGDIYCQTIQILPKNFRSIAPIQIK